MYYSHYDIVFQEVPDEISLAFYITGCNNKCKNCHSTHLNTLKTYYLTVDNYIELLNKYSNYISCVLFLGGEWNDSLESFLIIAKQRNFKTCLYTGLSVISNDIKQHLTYLKYGAYIESLGGLSSKTTNQRFINAQTNEDFTHKFWR